MGLTVVISGQSREFPTLDSPVTLAALVQALELQGDRIAIEYNGEISGRDRWPEIAVGSGDRLEFVHFVGGG